MTMHNTRAAVAALLISVVAACSGDNATPPPETGAAMEPYSVTQPAMTIHARADEDIDTVLPATPVADAIYSITPDLPIGLALDPLTGTISGKPLESLTATDFELRANTANGSHLIPLSLIVAEPLPAEIIELDSRFAARKLIANANVPVRMALAPDGRLFYIELETGKVRIVDSHSQLLEQPFASLSIISGMETGLLGLALDPEFASNGYLYLHATVGAEGNTDAHAEIIRFSAVGNRGVDQTTLVDELPIADLHNGGELVFDRHNHLFIGRGDISDPALAQTHGSLAGKVLRYTRDGAIPLDNPYPGDPEWSRGLRNTFAMTIHPQTGDLFGADAGPAENDKLNYLQAGKNFAWGLQQEAEGSDIGYSVRVWPEVITPTALLFHSGKGVTELTHNLFIASYNEESIHRLVLAGDYFTDFIREIPFARFDSAGIGNKPLHIIEASNGALYVSTFNAIYHLYPILPHTSVDTHR